MGKINEKCREWLVSFVVTISVREEYLEWTSWTATLFALSQVHFAPAQIVWGLLQPGVPVLPFLLPAGASFFNRWDGAHCDHAGTVHFSQKEIHFAPEAVATCLSGAVLFLSGAEFYPLRQVQYFPPQVQCFSLSVTALFPSRCSTFPSRCSTFPLQVQHFSPSGAALFSSRCSTFPLRCCNSSAVVI